jgi:hypothetical protein
MDRLAPIRRPNRLTYQSGRYLGRFPSSGAQRIGLSDI